MKKVQNDTGEAPEKERKTSLMLNHFLSYLLTVRLLCPLTPYKIDNHTKR
jgi:hypothetical protein